jgi:hypothetical protein
MSAIQQPPKAQFPFAPDRQVRVLEEILPARYYGRCKGSLTHAWVQIDNPPGICSVAWYDILKYEPSP